MKMKILPVLAASGALLWSAAGAAQNPLDGVEFSANMALTNDYKFYGYSQSALGWAIQGGIDFSHESGFYLGTWASSIDFVSGSSNPATIELDVYGGYSTELSNGLGVDVGVIRYGYPNTNDEVVLGGDLEYYEIYANFEYAFKSEFEPTISAGIAVSPDWFGETGTSVNPKGSLSLSLPQGFGLYGNIGYLDVDDINYSYTYYQIGLTKDFAGLSFDFAWADAEDDCGGDFCEGFIFTVSKEF